MTEETSAIRTVADISISKEDIVARLVRRHIAPIQDELCGARRDLQKARNEHARMERRYNEAVYYVATTHIAELFGDEDPFKLVAQKLDIPDADRLELRAHDPMCSTDGRAVSYAVTLHSPSCGDLYCFPKRIEFEAPEELALLRQERVDASMAESKVQQRVDDLEGKCNAFAQEQMRSQLMDSLVDNALEQINGNLKALLPAPLKDDDEQQSEETSD